jgi:hypothetical protein
MTAATIDKRPECAPLATEAHPFGECGTSKAKIRPADAKLERLVL